MSTIDRNSFQASNPLRRTEFALLRASVKARLRRGTGSLPARLLPTYPEVPAMWPNRAVRRAVSKGRMSRVPSEWLAAMAQRPGIEAAIKALA